MPLRVFSFAIILLVMTVEFSGQDRSYGRSVVMTERGIVATSHYLASQAGAQVLAQGGTAMDAAISANAVLGVTEPMMNGIGGDLFLIYWDAKTGKLYGLNSSGWAARRQTPDFMARQGITSMPRDGIHSVTVPGAVEGWSQAHKRFGRLPWKDLFSAAIYHAEHGFAVTEIVQGYWLQEEAKLHKTPEARRIFLPGGGVPELGSKFTNPDVAKALRLIAEQGRDAFYKGEIAQAIVQT
jgi:gamma-glutamyltranspeptidase / glutathione hydrolase